LIGLALFAKNDRLIAKIRRGAWARRNTILLLLSLRLWY